MGVPHRLHLQHRRFIAGLVQALPFGEPPIVRIAGCSAGATEMRRLLWRRVECDGVTEDHLRMSSARASLSFLRKLPRPYSRAEKQCTIVNKSSTVACSDDSCSLFNTRNSFPCSAQNRSNHEKPNRTRRPQCRHRQTSAGPVILYFPENRKNNMENENIKEFRCLSSRISDVTS